MRAEREKENFMKDVAKITDSFEYLSEKAKQNFQGHLSGLLEVHADFLHRITHAKGNQKTGIWIELSEAEILSGFILGTVSSLMGDYELINRTNTLLHLNYSSAQALLNQDRYHSLRNSIEDYRAGKTTKQDLKESLKNFIGAKTKTP